MAAWSLPTPPPHRPFFSMPGKADEGYNGARVEQPLEIRPPSPSPMGLAAAAQIRSRKRLGGEVWLPKKELHQHNA
uniref:Uncharacterized protein n=1 Tax=Leersia perrieri TaxID=77586 RepID=A0A0D9W4Q8_9ORYZ